ncbi:histidine kinase [Actinoplanes sp. TRM 88003]|uniref:histidine kinase n=1 Tax=Paractinoplanes aksuensis TaxID=2939490 RepID=A0ABT1DJD8_9ACTN|nr:histidine kinase [Actinoplanes aksuensis]MCO8270915.1 histidine kinase [Actinoplanes aksuensis]
MTAAAPSLLLRRLSRGQLIAIDGLLAAAAVLVCGYAATEAPTDPPGGWVEPGWFSVLLGLALGLPVAVRRLWPIAVSIAVLAVGSFAVGSGAIPFYAGTAPVFALGLVLYSVGLQVGRRRSVPIVLAAAVVVAAVFGATSHDVMGTGLVTWVVGACWATGRVVRERRAHALSRTEQATVLAVEQERLRIARELHDIVAHSMSMIAVKATIADHVGADRPDEMREALRVIATTSRETLGEIRRALGVVRAEAALRPTPGLADLDGLIEAARSTGLTVEFDSRFEKPGEGETAAKIPAEPEANIPAEARAEMPAKGRAETPAEAEAETPAAALPGDVALSVYRVVQEALTNVVRHSRATRCRVEVVTAEGRVDVRVTDNGGPHAPGPAAPDRPQRRGDDEGEAAVPRSEAGQGLIGMRERAAQFGGELSAGPQAGGGWRVATTLRYGS